MFSSACIISTHYNVFQSSVYFHAILTMICFSSACISVLSSPYAASVQRVFSCYPFQAMFEFSMYFGALLVMCSVQRVFPRYPLLLLCFSSVCISALSCPCYVSVQHAFWCYPHDVFSAYLYAILSLCCVSVQCVFPCYPLLVLCLISVCISALSCPSCFSSACILVLSL